MNLISHCKSLEFLSLAECPVDRLPEVDDLPSLPAQLRSLNVSTTKIRSWDEVEKLRKFQELNELRIQGCPFLDEYTAHEKRMMLIARLPNVKVQLLSINFYIHVHIGIPGNEWRITHNYCGKRRCGKGIHSPFSRHSRR